MSVLEKSVFQPLGWDHWLCGEEPSLPGSPLLHSASLHTAPRKACISPAVFPSSFAVFWDGGFVCRLGRAQKAQLQGDSYYYQLFFDEVVPIFTLSPALSRGRGNPKELGSQLCTLPRLPGPSFSLYIVTAGRFSTGETRDKESPQQPRFTQEARNLTLTTLTELLSPLLGSSNLDHAHSKRQSQSSLSF